MYHLCGFNESITNLLILPQQYFLNADTVMLAKDLLGKYIIRVNGEQTQQFMITETEAYHGAKDLACHARFGKTNRNQVMYQQGGVWYVYLCYGIHWMLNIVTGESDYPAAILLRGVDETHGPGRVTKLLNVDKTFNGLRSSVQSGLFVADDGVGQSSFKIKTTPRIGVDYAGEWAQKPWRFIIK